MMTPIEKLECSLKNEKNKIKRMQMRVKKAKLEMNAFQVKYKAAHLDMNGNWVFPTCTKEGHLLQSLDFIDSRSLAQTSNVTLLLFYAYVEPEWYEKTDCLMKEFGSA